MQEKKETKIEKIFNLFYLLSLPVAVLIYFINL